MLPKRVQHTYRARKARLLALFIEGARPTGKPRRHKKGERPLRCSCCRREELHGLAELRTLDGKVRGLGLDCLSMFRGLNATNIDDLRLEVEMG